MSTQTLDLVPATRVACTCTACDGDAVLVPVAMLAPSLNVSARLRHHLVARRRALGFSVVG